MTARHPDFVLFAGSTWQFDAALHDANCAALDLSGAAIEWRLYDSGGTPRITAATPPGTGITITDAVGGLCKITVAPAQTAPLAAGNYSDEIRCTLATGFISVQSIGRITVAVAGAPAAPPDLQAQLASLKAARAQGINSISIEGYTTVFRSDAEMRTAIASLESEIAAASGVPPVRNVNVRSKGWS